MKKYYGYIRVSTVRQGEVGTSLAQQRSAIETYCRRENITVTAWFEEMETAARAGRSVFLRMLKHLRAGGAHGLVLHKIDRGARNLRDWAELSHLVDSGIDVRIAGDSVDLKSRGGRLSGDILAVVAADYVRNLSDEVKKGQTGRLKQGRYPWPAPIGYLDTGPGAVKIIDPVRGPQIREAYALFATGRYSIRSLRTELFARGLRSITGNPVSKNTLHRLLRNPFYYGRIEATSGSYVGTHEPLISERLFRDVQDVLSGRWKRTRSTRHHYAFRRRLVCATCSHHLYAEQQKGHVYYRCHRCKGICVRESSVATSIAADVCAMALGRKFRATLCEAFDAIEAQLAENIMERRQSAVLQLGQLQTRANKLLDAFLDGVVDQESYEARNEALVDERLLVQAKLTTLDHPGDSRVRLRQTFLELLSSLENIANSAAEAELAGSVLNAISNLVVRDKNIEITWRSAVNLLLSNRKSPERLGATGHAPNFSEKERAELVAKSVLSDGLN